MIPEQWKEIIHVLMLPVSWIPGLQREVFQLLFQTSGWYVAPVWVLLFFPAMLALAAIWCNQLSLYTLPLRAGRIAFIKTMLLAWWDAALSCWLYWVGLGRFFVVIVGWFFTLARFAVRFVAETFRQLILLPITMTGKVTQTFFRPGVPWVALSMLVFWCLLESVIFSFTLYPTVSEMLGSLVGGVAPALAKPVLFVFLFLLIMGSFACVHVLAEAFRNREYKYVVQMVLVEIFVMIFEVMFLYRELVDAITPWIAQQTGGKMQLGIVFTLSLATFGWVGIRGMTWFLFGQYGTPPLLAIISRRPMSADVLAGGIASPSQSVVAPWWRTPIEELKKELAFLHQRATEVLEYLTLPVIHVIAAALNFAMILVASRPVFSIPFQSLHEVFATRQLMGAELPLAKKTTP
jgi:hypothetical protein